jgi:hypothetical protein
MADNSISFALLARDMASPAFKSVGNSAKEAEGKLGGVAGAALKVGSALAGLAVVKDVFTTGLRETKDYQAGLAQLQAGLKSTHDASGMTADGMEKLASKIQGYSGQTDDSIVKSESLLLTFRNIHDQTGKNNDIFTQATKLTADMAARFGGEASDNAVKLGRALNDPVKGLSALSRMGIQFSASQTSAIKAMVASGNTLGAQKLIIDQVTKAVGGSASAFGKTLPGQIEIAHRKFEDVSQTLVTKLTPALSTSLTWVSKGIDFFGRYSKIILPVAGIIGTMVVAYKAWIAAQAVLNAVMTANPIGLVIVAIAGLTAGLIVAYNKCATFRHIVQDTFGWISKNWPLLVQIIGAPIEPLIQLGLHFTTFKKIALDGIRVVLSAFLDMASGIVHGAATAFGWVPGVGGKLKKARDAFDEFKTGVLNDLNSLDGTHVVHVNVRTAVGDAAAAVSLPNKASQYASGGLVRGPGGPRSDLIPALLSNGEAVVPAHLVPHVAPFLAAHGVPGFADGGLVVQTNAATAGAGLRDKLNSIIDGALSRMASMFSFGGGGAGVQQWAGLVSQVLGMLGLSPLLLGKALSQMATESGGNPNAINLTDSNARAGHPSQGLMQVIPGTFAAYAGPFAGLGILNPLANIYAGLNYAMHRYGPGLAGLGEGHGYDSGGWLKPGVSLTYNGTGKPEAVLTHEQWRQVRGGVTVIIQGGVFADEQSKDRLAKDIATRISRARANGGGLPAVA